MKPKKSFTEMLEDSTTADIKFNEYCYKQYTRRAIDLQEQLNKTLKIFKNKRLNLSKQIKQLNQKADKYFNNYINSCIDLADLYKE